MATGRAEQRRQKAIKTLQQMNERVLQSRVIEPYFKRINWVPYNVHGLREGTHGCDLILTSPLHYGDVLRGVQLKNKLDIGDGGDVDKNILTDATTAIQYEHPPFYKRFDRFFWITTGEISQSGWIGVKERIDNNSVLFGRRVVVWDVKRLVWEIDNAGCGDLLDDLDLNRLERAAGEHEKDEEGVFAAHYWHRIGRWYLTNGNPEAAKEAFDRATHLLKGDPRKSIYYHRTLIRYSEMWSQLAGRWREVDPRTDGDHLVDIARSPRARTILAEDYSESMVSLLEDLESIFEQMDLLQELQSFKYAGLVMLQITRLLLRAGYPPTLPGLEERLACIDRDLGYEDGRSIDQKCSLCTATAVSCYALANWGAEADAAADWLKGLESCRYCHRESRMTPSGQHALHYAATVLIALLDRDERNAARKVANVFFRSEKEDSQGIYLEWMLYRGEDRFWVCRTIFSAFLWLFLSGDAVDEERKFFLLHALKAMTVSLDKEASEVSASRSFYPIRENLGSFTFGMVLGDPESQELAEEVIGILRKRATESARLQDESRRKELWASNIERTQIFIEGLLQHWESVIYLEGQDALRSE